MRQGLTGEQRQKQCSRFMQAKLTAQMLFQELV